MNAVKHRSEIKTGSTVEIVSYLNSGWTMKKIAGLYGVTAAAVWAHLHRYSNRYQIPLSKDVSPKKAQSIMFEIYTRYRQYIPLR